MEILLCLGLVERGLRRYRSVSPELTRVGVKRQAPQCAFMLRTLSLSQRQWTCQFALLCGCTCIAIELTPP